MMNPLPAETRPKHNMQPLHNQMSTSMSAAVLADTGVLRWPSVSGGVILLTDGAGITDGVTRTDTIRHGMATIPIGAAATAITIIPIIHHIIQAITVPEGPLPLRVEANTEMVRPGAN